jgi:hypothetical protein
LIVDVHGLQHLDASLAPDYAPNQSISPDGQP